MTTRPGFIWSGTEWVAIGQNAAINPVKYQATAPTSPSTGDYWIDSDSDSVAGILNQNDYLLKADATTTYLTQSNAASTYVTKAEAADATPHSFLMMGA